jgi:universal stress protein E
MINLESIVIGTSLAAESDDVVRAGVALARQGGAAVRLVHAFAPLTAWAGLPAEVIATFEWDDGLQHSLRQQLEEQARRTGLADLPGYLPEHCVLAVCPTHLALLETALVTGAGLIVVGASERQWHLLSPTADRLLRKAHCPVFVVRQEAVFPPRRVLLPVDLSEISAESLRYGVSLLEGLGEPRCEVLFVLNPLTLAAAFQFTAAQVKHFAGDELARFVRTHVPEPGRLGREVRTGYPGLEIVKVLAEHAIDLVVLGTHGHGHLEQMLTGSVTSDVLREARCNVLAVPPGFRPEAAALRTDRAPAGAGWSCAADEAGSAA